MGEEELLTSLEFFETFGQRFVDGIQSRFEGDVSTSGPEIETSDRASVAKKAEGGSLILGKQLLDKLDALFVEYEPAPSVLHGDLWGGNWGATDGQPIIFDPAVHYGDRECDIAMTKLFGGFGLAFYEAYHSAWPLADGCEARQLIYQLYHVLNHLNLFGVSYLARAIQLMRSLTFVIPQ